ncbi:multi-sensor hybrid histidine kinase [Stylonychia lemnae]|uniref:Multi-sensor hybrid histidine kinase n=1 Tax=Stylonychia lemnae TaxID=5949 RepID=A0A078AGA0_STYLE|nr:multi-sensor hybrid histidine kinase [Stylonychia lemnae]|eukprot:CDW81259.1 multi-sensor hybrid histidine kinase [Stylonychia lemnae]
MVKIPNIFERLSLRRKDQKYSEEEFRQSRLQEQMILIKPLYEISIYGTLPLTFHRAFIEEYRGFYHNYIMTQSVLMVFFVLYILGRYSPRHYDAVNITLCFTLSYLYSKKVTSQSPDKFIPNTVLVLQMFQNLFVGLYSTLEWYQISLVQLLIYIGYIISWSLKYGLFNLPTDLFVHFSFCYALLVSLVRKKEINDRRNFKLWKKLNKYKEKLHKILFLLHEGVLIINAKEKCDRIIYHNKALVQIFMGESYKLHNQSHKYSFDFLNSDQDNNNQNSSNNKKQDQNDQQYMTLNDLGIGISIQEEFNQQKKINQSLSSFIEKIRKNISKSSEQQKFYIKLQPNNISIEINVVSFEQDSQILLLFKEIGAFKKLQKSKTREQFTNVFINSTAHNIFTPINGMIGVQQLLERTVSNNQEAMQYCHLMSNCLHNLIFNTKNIIELSKIRLKKSVQKIDEIRLNVVLDEIVHLFNQEIAMKKIKINKSIQSLILNNNLLIDHEKLQLVLFNILSNAFKYTQSGFIVLTAKIMSYRELQLKIEDDCEESQDQITNQVNDEPNTTQQLIQSTPSSQKLDDYRQKCIQSILNNGCVGMQYLSFSVIDTGVGMDQNNTRQLFNLFGKVKLSDEQISQSGIGLGLTVSNLICEDLGGKLFLEWTLPGKGSKFQLYLPVQINNDQSSQSLYFNQSFSEEVKRDTNTVRQNWKFKDNLEISEIDDPVPQKMRSEYQEELQPISQRGFHKKQQSANLIPLHQFKIKSRIQTRELIEEEYSSILVVDDCAFNIDILQMMLNQLFSLRIDYAMSGQDALKKVKSRLYQHQTDSRIQMYKLIIMDINMPVMDGVEATKSIKQELLIFNQYTKIVAHTAMPEEQFRTNAERWFDGFLPKPLNSNKLHEMLIDAKIK